MRGKAAPWQLRELTALVQEIGLVQFSMVFLPGHMAPP